MLELLMITKHQENQLIALLITPTTLPQLIGMITTLLPQSGTTMMLPPQSGMITMSPLLTGMITISALPDTTPLVLNHTTATA
jgi:hypothetical protein